MDEIIIYKSRWKALRIGLLALPFIAAAIYALFFHKYIMPVWILWAGLVFFGTCFLVVLFNFFDRRPQIIINGTGIFDRTAYKDFINWNTIDHAYWTTVYGQPFVCLIIKEEFRQLIDKDNKVKDLNLALGFQEVNISLGGVSNVNKERLTALIINLSDAKASDRSKLITQTRPLMQ